MDLLEQVQRMSTKLTRELKHLSYEDRRPTVFGLFRLEESRLQGDLPEAFHYLRGAMRDVETDFLQEHLLIGQRGMTLN